MRTIFEAGFDIVYLSFVIIVGIYMIVKSGNNKQYKLFGVMSLTLGLGDSFHLIPRIFALVANDFSKYAVYLGYGKLITSITMTLFYLILYYIYLIRYSKEKSFKITVTMVLLGVIRIALCFLPGNDWTSLTPPVVYGIIRNIPFAIMGIIVIYLYFVASRKYKDRALYNIYLSVIFSFGFYIPVVLWAHVYPIIGALMIPKTIAYAYIVMLLFKEFRKCPKTSTNFS